MIRRSALALGALVLIAGLPASAAVDSALAALIPSDASTVSGANVAQAKNSAFGRFVLSQLTVDDRGLQKFISDTGFDPRRDLNDVIVATIGTGDKAAPVVLGRGIFNPGKILNAAKLQGATVTNYKGVDIATAQDGAIAFVDATIAIAGLDKAVRAAVDQRTTAKKLPDAVLKKMQELSGANDAWFYSLASPGEFFGDKFANPELGNVMQTGLMQAITQASGGLKFTDKEMKVNGEAVTRSDKDATALVDVLKFLTQMVQGNAKGGDAADAAALLSKMQVSATSNVMKMSLAVPEELMERIFAGRKAGVAAR